jgi:hypothetical protein
MILIEEGLYIGINKMKRKFEALNPKSETNPKAKCSKFKIKTAVYVGIYFLFWSFVFWAFEFVSNFDIRISDLFLGRFL